MSCIIEIEPPPKQIEPKGSDGASLPTEKTTTHQDRHDLPVKVETEVTRRDFSELARQEEGYDDYDRS